VDDKEFQIQSDAALEDLFRRLTRAADQHGFEADFNAGALTIEFEEPPAKFIVSPNSPVHQIWVSAHSKSFKFAWDSARCAFVLPTGQTLAEMLAEAASQQTGASIAL
jgi:CyaY protein